MVKWTSFDLSEVLGLSHTYGRNPLWIIGGGGNISLKQGKCMWIKASGRTLDTIQPEGFVGMNLEALYEMVQRNYPEDPSDRERIAKEVLLSCYLPGEEQKRPSVETGMHAVLPHRIVFHTHPTLVNGVTCSRDGKGWVEKLFGDRVLWVPVVNPGIVLSQYLADNLSRYMTEHSHQYPMAIFLQNHGLVVYGESAEEIQGLHQQVEGILLHALPARLQSLYEKWKEEAQVSHDPSINRSFKMQTRYAQILERLRAGYQEEKEAEPSPIPTILIDSSAFFRPYYSSRSGFSFLEGPFTPDHVVYAGHRPLWVAQPSLLQEAIRRYKIQEGGLPRVIVVKGVGLFCIGQNEGKARIIYLLVKDMARISCLAEVFGGVQFMPVERTEFIRHWEVEQFRQKVT